MRNYIERVVHHKWVAITMRLDISYTVCKLPVFIANSSSMNEKLFKRLKHHINGTLYYEWVLYNIE